MAGENTKPTCRGSKSRLGPASWVLVGTLVAWFSWAPEAEAQTVTLDERNITRLLPYRQSRRWWINYEECLANDVFSFPLSLTSTSGTVEVWVGNQDCAEVRDNTTERGQCWIVAATNRPEDTLRIDVPVRNIVARQLNVTDPPLNPGPEVCDANDDPSGEQFTFYFLLQQGGASVGTHDSWQGGPEGTGFDLVGPAPPGDITVGIGESQLSIRVRGVEEDDDRERFEAFCVPAGTLAPEDAGVDLAPAVTGADAGTSPAPMECFTDIISGGARPPGAFSCGIGQETSTTMRTDTLTNDVPYAVGVSGQDIVGNAGPLSAIQCGTPRVLDDFYEVYSRSGGQGGGGFCSLGRTSTKPGAWGTLAALALAFRLRRSPRAGATQRPSLRRTRGH